jgi:hypothetical protein
MSEHSGSNSGSNSSTPSTPYPVGGGGNTTGTLPNTTATWPNLQETLQFERAASAIISDRPHTISSGDPSSMSSLTLFCKLVIHAQCKTEFFAGLSEFSVTCCFHEALPGVGHLSCLISDFMKYEIFFLVPSIVLGLNDHILFHRYSL